MRCFWLLVLCVLGMASASWAETLTLDENVIPNNPINGFGSFTFDDFGSSVTASSMGLIIDAEDSDGSNGVFGGFGVDFLLEDPPTSGTFVPQDFEASTARWELRVKILPNNAATAIRTTFIDDDGGGAADEHVYEFDLTGVPNDGQFHTLTAPLTAPLFTQTAFGFSAGNGIVDPGLRQIQIQSVFGSTGRLNVEVDFARIVPEPSSLFFTLVASVAAMTQSRRSSRSVVGGRRNIV